MRGRGGFRVAVGLVLLSAVTSVRAGIIEDHYGKWLGKISIPNGPTVSIGFELFVRADGSPGANLVSPDQGQFIIPVDHLSGVAERIELEQSPLHVHIRLTAEADVLVGEFQQSGLALPIELKRVGDFGEPVRPQTPKAPFPYGVSELVVTAPDGAKLAGTLTRPRGDKPVTVVVLLHGSGPADRDESIEGHHWFGVLADYLTRHGLAVYRYDKRGIMRSTGDYNSTVSSVLADDGYAAVRVMRARKDIAHVGIIGHSEGGGLAATIAAAHPQSVDFVVSLAGSGLQMLDLILLQDRIGYERRGLSRRNIDMLMNYDRSFYSAVVMNEAVEPRATALSALQNGMTDEDTVLVREYASKGTLNPSFATLPAERAWLTSDAPPWWHVKCPALILNGTLDVQVPAEENLRAISSALAAGGNTRSQVESLPGLNHLFQTAKTGLEEEYGNLDETIAPIVLQRMRVFITSQHLAASERGR